MRTTPSRRNPNLVRNRETLVAPGGVIAVRRVSPYWTNGTRIIPVISGLVNHRGVSEATLIMAFPYCGWYSWKTTPATG